MKFCKRMLSLLLAAALFLSCLPGWALTASADGEEEQTETVTLTTVVDAELPSEDELYEGYLEKLFFSASGISLWGTAARDQLNPLGQKLYDFLKAEILKVAAGEISSTIFAPDMAQIPLWGAEMKFTADTAEAAAALFLEQFEFQKVVRALLHDCPYELYWYDKVKGVGEPFSFTKNGNIYTVTSVDFRFAVSGGFQPDGYNSSTPTFDTACVTAASAAAANAQAIVDACVDMGNYEKLVAYKDKICALVSYDHDSAASGNFSTDADPWQLIYVFDGDSSTNVVCEGYAKAFQYLCDLTTFRGDVCCYTVTGTSNGGGHMWNIVEIDGKHYLADVTNSDTGAVGQSGGLFLVGSAVENLSDGYLFSSIRYLYDSSTFSIWGTGNDSILRLAESSYDYCTHNYKAVKTVEPTCTEKGYTTYVCSRCGDSYDSDFVKAQGHNYQEKSTVSPTCTEKGYTTYVCSRCSDSCKDNYVNAVGHSFGPWNETKTATCTKSGQESRKCESCGVSETRETKALGHSLTPTVTAPTCTEKGFTTHSCTRCGYSYTDTYVDAAGHSFGPWTETNAATCAKAGQESRKCTSCGDTETREIKASGHSYTSVVTAPTCGEKGFTTHTCSACGDHYEDTYTDPTGEHVYENDQDTTCDVCGFTRVVSVPMYRLYNPYTQEHLLTGSADEKDGLVKAGWSLDGVAWNSPSEGTPVYRLYNPYDDWHTYSVSQEEIDTLVPLGWKVDGVVCRSADEKDGTPIFRLFNPYEQKNYHLLTASTQERDSLAELGWKFEGIAWYALAD